MPSLHHLRTAAIVALLLAGAPAQAAIVSGGFSGVIAGNTRDTYGLFAAAGSLLSGHTLAASYSYDTAAAFTLISQPGSDALLGTGNLTLSVTIDGVSVTTSGVTDSEVIDTADGADTEIQLANFAPTPLIDFTLFARDPWVSGVTIFAPFALDPANTGQDIYVTADGRDYDALYFTPLAAAEPGTVAILGLGLAMLGLLRHPGRWLWLFRGH